jgi:hypothetical protein
MPPNAEVEIPMQNHAIMVGVGKIANHAVPDRLRLGIERLFPAAGDRFNLAIVVELHGKVHVAFEEVVPWVGDSTANQNHIVPIGQVRHIVTSIVEMDLFSQRVKFQDAMRQLKFVASARTTSGSGLEAKISVQSADTDGSYCRAYNEQCRLRY